jgi:polygalacturonase
MAFRGVPKTDSEKIMDRSQDSSEERLTAVSRTAEVHCKRDWLNVQQLGAAGDGSAPCTTALQRAIDICGERRGGTVFVPSGTYVTGTLWMRSHVTLHLDSGAHIIGQKCLDAFPLWQSKWEGSAAPLHAPLIAGEGLRNIALMGRGAIDGNGQFWWDLLRRGQLRHGRPSLVRIVDSRDVLIDGLTFTNSPYWTVNPTACNDVTITNISIRNPHDSPNTDGINPDSCSNVRISNCHIDVGDDCIAIKSGSEEDGRPNLRLCENISITNCAMMRGHGGLVIGSEMSGGVRNVAISNCVMCGTDRGIRLKSRRGRGSVVENLQVDNIIMDGVLCPIVVNQFYVCGAPEDDRLLDSPQPVTSATPQFRRLRFSNITARNVKYAAMFVLGLPEMFVDDMVLDGVSIYMDPANRHAGPPAMAAGVTDMCRAGFVLRNARNVKLRRIEIYNQLGPAVIINNSQEILVSDLSASVEGNEPLITVDGAESSVGNDDLPMEGRAPDNHDDQRVRTFTRGWRVGRRPTRVASEEALSSLRTKSSPI